MPRSYMADFMAGVDPTGTSTFQYGMEDARKGQSSQARRLVGAAGGVLGGAAAIPAAVGGTVGGVKGFLMGKGGLKQRLLSAGKGLLSGAHRPYSSIYRGVQANRALAAHEAGKMLNPQQAKHLERFVHSQLPQSMSYAAKIDPRAVQQGLKKLNPQQLSNVRRELGGEIGAGAAALGLSGAISGGSAYMQYAKGGRTGDVLREARVPTTKISSYYESGYADTLKQLLS